MTAHRMLAALAWRRHALSAYVAAAISHTVVVACSGVASPKAS